MIHPKVLIVVGTRPDSIKMAPLFQKLKGNSNFETFLCSSGQHLELLKQALDIFDIVPDFELKVMTENQSLTELTMKIIDKFSKLCDELKPDLIMVHGDTTTAFASALTAYYKNIPVAHIEAGLRTQDIFDPFPEEFNRQAIARISKWNFVPTETARTNLLNEGINPNTIYLTGNTIVDSVNLIKNKIECEHIFEEKLLDQSKSILNFDPKFKKFILVTMHRRESFGEGVINVCNSLKEIAQAHPDLTIVFSVHLNPKVRNDVINLLDKHKNIILSNPIPYNLFIYLMIKSLFLITDSGGIQEEAVTLGKKVLVTRNKTERVEGVENGILTVISTNPKDIVFSVTELLNLKSESKNSVTNTFGSGDISSKIIEHLESELKLS